MDQKPQKNTGIFREVMVALKIIMELSRIAQISFPPLSSHSRPARNFWSKRLIFNPSVHIMDGKMAMAESMACMSNHLAICRRILHVRSNPILGVFREDGKIIMAFSTRRRTFPSKGHFKLYLDQNHLFFAQKRLMAG